jgi:hypothetical protein
MFGRDEELEKIRAALAAVGADMSAFRGWQKQYEKVNKQWQTVQERYNDALLVTRQVQSDARLLERLLVAGGALNRQEFSRILKDLKRLQNSFDHEFLISREDVEFHSTYDTILRLGMRSLDAQDQRLILQSEVENLLDLLKENLEKTAPNPRKLCLFYQYGTDKELAVLSPADRLARIERVYDSRFLRPILLLLTEAVQRAEPVAERLRGKDDRRSKRTLAAIQVLLDTEGEPQERAQALLDELMK